MFFLSGFERQRPKSEQIQTAPGFLTIFSPSAMNRQYKRYFLLTVQGNWESTTELNLEIYIHQEFELSSEIGSKHVTNELH